MASKLGKRAVKGTAYKSRSVRGGTQSIRGRKVESTRRRASESHTHLPKSGRKVASIRGRGPDQLYRIWSGLDPISASSTNVKSFAYDEQTRILFVEFLNESLYAYDAENMYSFGGDPFLGMYAAMSKGKYVFDVLRGADGHRRPEQYPLDYRFDYCKVE